MTSMKFLKYLPNFSILIRIFIFYFYVIKSSWKNSVKVELFSTTQIDTFLNFFSGSWCNALFGAEPSRSRRNWFSFSFDRHGKIPLFGTAITSLWYCRSHYKVRNIKFEFFHRQLIKIFKTQEKIRLLKLMVGQLKQPCFFKMNLKFKYRTT